MDTNNNQRTDLSKLHLSVNQMRQEIGKVLVGQEKMLNLLMAALLAEGHVLIEGVPGVAKTLTAKLMSRLMDVDFARIQFTPDLMPSDLLGTSVFNPREALFQFKQGPIFSNVILIDEINRSPAKTQAALFEVMEEHQVTMDGVSYQMEKPFLVLATQNPIEQEGTYRLPEAQLDRFLFHIQVGYPSLEEEIQIIKQQHQSEGRLLSTHLSPVLSKSDLLFFREQVRNLIIDDQLLEYVAKIVHATRSNSSLYMGASPRASLAIVKSAKAVAAMSGRDFVIPEDIIYVAPSVLRHRIMLTPDKEMEGVQADEVVEQLMQTIEVPR